MHYPQGWYYEDTNEEKKSIESGTLLESIEPYSSVGEQEVINTYQIIASLGTSIIVNVWDGVDSSGDPAGNKIDTKVLSEGRDDFKIVMPQWNQMNDSNGNVFMGWSIGNRDIINYYKPNESFFDEYANYNYQAIIDIAPAFGKMVNMGGTYSFATGQEYSLSKGTWVGSDGYTYIVNEEDGKIFYATSKNPFTLSTQ